MINLIYDRTQRDYDAAVNIISRIGTKSDGTPDMSAFTAAERVQYNAGLRGAYNASDMNRVASAVRNIAARLTAEGYPVTPLGRASWPMGHKVTRAEWTEYIADVARVRDGFVPLASLPALPSPSDALSLGGANAIERILHELDVNIEIMIGCYRLCGTFQAGSPIGLPLKRS